MNFSAPEYVALPPKYDNAKDINSRMAIWFDLHIYDDPAVRDDTKLYTYLYNICNMLAHVEKFFPDYSQHYEYFSHYMATKVYMRYINPKHQGEDDRIVSVLNYCKGTLGHTRCDYQNENFAEIYGTHPKGTDNCDTFIDGLKEGIRDDYNKSRGNFNYFEESIRELPEVLDEVLKETNYTKDPIMIHRLRISILLSIFKDVSVSSTVKSRGRTKTLDDDKLAQILMRERDANITLWKLDDMYYNLVHLLTAKTRRKLADRMGQSIHALRLSQEDVDGIFNSAYGNIARDDNEEF